MKSMDETPTLHRYRIEDRAEVLDFVREVYPAPVSARMISQWTWKHEANPYTWPAGPAVDFLRVGNKLVSLATGFRLRLWMGGIECLGENRGTWIVHPEYRRRNMWARIGALQATDSPVLIGWSRLPPRVVASVEFGNDPLRPLLRILDAGPLAAHITQLPSFASIGAAASAAGRMIARPFRRTRDRRNGVVTRIEAFDERVDELCARVRNPEQATVVRDHRYLNWRYPQRPDATYLMFGLERAARLDGFLVARMSTYLGMRWGNLIDFLAADYARDLPALLAVAMEEFRRGQVAAVSCYATDLAARGALFRSGFFPIPQRKPIRFVHFIRPDRPDLAKFKAVKAWYLTMGDGDLELAS
jgi:hypothetical protein